MFDRKRPYNDLPPLPPNKLLETRDILKKAIEAHGALSELKHRADFLPNQAVLVQTLGIQEAKLSSEIENIVTTNDELYRSYLEDDTFETPEAKEVLNYPTALWYGYKAIKEDKRLLTASLFEEICQILKGNTSGIRKIIGTKLTNASGEVIYTPPEGESLIREKLKQLEVFIYANKDFDSLIKLALIHYQFEAIHPFHDGNGRTGRIINLLYLIDCGLLNLPILYLSRFFLQNRADYYKGIRLITEEEKWEAWIHYILDAVIITAKETNERIVGILELMKQTSQKIKTELPRIYSRELVETIFLRPYCKIKSLEDAGIAQRDTASSYLKKLENIGILHSFQKGRDKYYINEAFVKILS